MAAQEPVEIDYGELTHVSYMPRICPITYAYDYLKDVDGIMTLPGVYWVIEDDHLSAQFLGTFKYNAIPLDPRGGGLVWRTGLDCAMQNKFWQAGVAACRVFLTRYLDAYGSSNEVAALGRTLDNMENKQTRLPIYMFPFATGRRFALIAEMCEVMFLLDDLWDQGSDDQVLNLGAEFYNRIHGHAPEDLDHTPLQKRIRQVVKAIRTRDANGGDGGAGMLTALLQFAERAAPPANFATIPAYYSYRTNHAATKFFLACVKFSIASSVSPMSPRLRLLTGIATTHAMLTNDFASYHKERTAHAAGRTRHLINFIDFKRKLHGGVDEQVGLFLAHLNYGQCENDLYEQLNALRGKDELNEEEWAYVYALMAMCAGNVFASTTSLRYGSEEDRVVETA